MPPTLKVVLIEINVTAATADSSNKNKKIIETMQNQRMEREPANRITAAALAAKYRGKRELYT